MHGLDLRSCSTASREGMCWCCLDLLDSHTSLPSTGSFEHVQFYLQCDFRWRSSCGLFGTLIKHLRCFSLQQKHRHTMELKLQRNKLEILHCREIILRKLLIIFSILHETHLHQKSSLCVGGVKTDLFYSLKVCIRKIFFVWVGWRLICSTL
jgi:hypothetical protein